MSLPSYILTQHEEDSEVTISIDLDMRYLAALLLHVLQLVQYIAGPYYAALRFDYRDNCLIFGISG